MTLLGTDEGLKKFCGKNLTNKLTNKVPGFSKKVLSLLAKQMKNSP